MRCHSRHHHATTSGCRCQPRCPSDICKRGGSQRFLSSCSSGKSKGRIPVQFLSLPPKANNRIARRPPTRLRIAVAQGVLTNRHTQSQPNKHLCRLQIGINLDHLPNRNFFSTANLGFTLVADPVQSLDDMELLLKLVRSADGAPWGKLSQLQLTHVPPVCPACSLEFSLDMM